MPSDRRPLFGRVMDSLMAGQFVMTSNNKDPELEPHEKESLFRYQLEQSRPQYLTALSFKEAGIVQGEAVSTILSSNDSESKKIYKALIGLEILPDPKVVETAPPGTVQPVDTTKIDKRFTNKLYTTSIGSQRRVVGMLFFWEEECMRWRLLDEELSEVEAMIEQAPRDMKAELEIRREAILMKKRQGPAERSHSVPEDAPPNYQHNTQRSANGDHAVPQDALPKYDSKN